MSNISSGLKSRIILVCIVVAFSAAGAFAKPVDLVRAQRAGLACYTSSNIGKSDRAILSLPQLSLAYQCRAGIAPGDSQTVYYAFNVAGDHGFVIVAGDDAVAPILAYSSEGNISMKHPSPEFTWWMSLYQRQIVAVIQKGEKVNATATAMWRKLESRDEHGALAAVTTVGPLVKTTWNQSPYYNDLCPYDAAASERTVTGCVATAFSQIMKYHGYPARGTGDHSYSQDKYGSLYANFANSTYDWNAMPNRVTEANPAVARLMYDVGVSCNMTYGPGATGGSGAYPQDAGEALKKYFGYQATVRMVEKKDYDENAWASLIRGELDAARPVEYHGFSDEGGHSFVCDGYQDQYFHINWGWDGEYNGYFLFSSMAPDGVGTGGGSGNYTDGQGAVIGIAPGGSSTVQTSMKMYAALNASPNPATANGPVTVTFDIVNSGTAAFAGDYCAALFDNTGTFVKYLGGIQHENNLPANSHYTNGFTLVDTLFGVYPGTYSIGVYARPTGKEWVAIDKGSFSNTTSLEVDVADYGTDLSMYSDAVLSPVAIHSGEPFHIQADFINRSGAQFEGSIIAYLYNLNGDYVDSVTALTGLQLDADYHWKNGLSFSGRALNIPPGRYMLAFFSNNGGGDLQIVNPETYRNPMIIEILPALLVADRYEPNNTVAQAAPLDLQLSGGQATITTDGANLHVSEDNDFYRVDLPAGYWYDVTARVHDSQNDAAGGYTNDVSVMENTGGGWSSVFDDATDVVRVEGGRSLLFKVQPIFSGTTGTYGLDVDVVRQGPSGVDTDPAVPVMALNVFPSPANNEIFVDIAPSISGVRDISIVDISGVVVASRAMGGQVGGRIRLDVSGLPSGSYRVVVGSKSGTFSHAVIINR
ncbi:MAG: Peptidase family protein [Chlorobi bacterium]|nr:Peptidase family protein [Chlorobiota bacterium]